MSINKKFLVVRPKYGLCNQIYCISKGIIFGLISNRDVIFSKFQLDSLWKLIDTSGILSKPNQKLIFENDTLVWSSI